MIRKHVAKGTKEGKELAKYSNKGLLAPDEIVTNMLISELDAHKNITGTFFS